MDRTPPPIDDVPRGFCASVHDSVSDAEKYEDSAMSVVPLVRFVYVDDGMAVE